MAPSSAIQTSRPRRPLLTPSSIIRGLYPTETHKNWLAWQNNPTTLHRGKEFKNRTKAIEAHLERKRNIEEEETHLTHLRSCIDKFRKFGVKVNDESEKEGKGKNRLFDVRCASVSKDYAQKLKEHTRRVSSLSRSSVRCARDLRKINEIVEERRQLMRYGEHYLGSGGLAQEQQSG